ncbi:MAG: bifunctional phosphoribosylaminoimidazolecarboxamide formyltransferase/IMP cyclohydrolase [Treponema sp.]|jgi:phosphoribosylaminoimidazolecarboxamide formyltransferase/IMP cyclohydrolase|nr:bifunctional phosphoribosylaminoimidazolecarboxamide formyltransferase/IMP cyclohydrolase [Treponema sp.]
MKRALISVYHKEGVLELASFLGGSGWEILSTGGTSAYLQERGVPVTDVSSVTGFPECLDGRVKTLHPAVHAGLLARRDLPSHMETLDRLGILPVDLVCVNLYPFFEKVRAGLSPEETIEFIDIGGPAMLRSAAKNHRDVIVLSDPADYPELMAGLKAGTVPAEFRRRLAGKVFNLTAAYDGAVARYLLADGAGPEGAAAKSSSSTWAPSPPETAYPAYWPLSLKKAQGLRYGENGHQGAALYFNTGAAGALESMEQLHGKELGYNNIRDLDLAWKAVCAFGLYPEGAEAAPPMGEGDLLRLGVPAGDTDRTGARRICCAAVKHNTPCGVALGATLLEAYEKTHVCDPVSIFGGVVAVNVSLDAAAARRLSDLFLEIVAAPGFDGEALEILRKKKNVRIVKLSLPPQETHECVTVDGGLLVQEADRRLMEKWEPVTGARPAPEDIRDMIFGMRAVTFVKSNAIVVVKDLAAVGIGGGQTNRIWAAEQALERSRGVIRAAAENGTAAGGGGGAFADGKPARVLASDAFFPFADVVESAAAAGIRAIIQPGGSIRDRESIEACDRHGIAMVFTGTRHFKH